jgi:hypothetical protein
MRHGSLCGLCDTEGMRGFGPTSSPRASDRKTGIEPRISGPRIGDDSVLFFLLCFLFYFNLKFQVSDPSLTFKFKHRCNKQ